MRAACGFKKIGKIYGLSFPELQFALVEGKTIEHIRSFHPQRLRKYSGIITAFREYFLKDGHIAGESWKEEANLLDWPTVSIIVTCYNESACIEKCLDSIIAFDYPGHLLEIIVVDGMSDDGTRELIKIFCQFYGYIQMIDNPRRLKPAGNNLGIMSASHEYVLIMDGHTAYPPDYIEKVIAGSIATGSDNYGGIIEVVPRNNTLTGQTLAAVNTSPFAVGNAYYRIGTDQVRKVDTVPFGCFKRELFNRIGLFNPDLPRAEDRDLNARIISAGGSIYLDPSIQCRYFIRSNLKEYLKWIKQNGLWVFYASRFTDTSFRSWRNYIPLLFLLYCLALLPLYLAAPPALLFTMLFPLGLYLFLDILFSARIAIHNRLPLAGLLAAVYFPLTHFAYGLGSIQGIIKLFYAGQSADVIDHRQIGLRM